MTTSGHTYTFTYDDVGNELNELVREDNEVINKTIVYAYDLGGNILSITEYPYTTGDLVQLQKQSTTAMQIQIGKTS
jgi:hypothetical protein